VAAQLEVGGGSNKAISAASGSSSHPSRSARRIGRLSHGGASRNGHLRTTSGRVTDHRVVWAPYGYPETVAIDSPGDRAIDDHVSRRGRCRLSAGTSNSQMPGRWVASVHWCRSTRLQNAEVWTDHGTPRPVGAQASSDVSAKPTFAMEPPSQGRAQSQGQSADVWPMACGVWSRFRTVETYASTLSLG
jgi:hypothetical protein